MPQSHSIILIHLVFSTKDRRPWLTPDLRPRVWAYQATLLNSMECPVYHVSGVEDHVHLLFSLSKNSALVNTIRDLKANSSRWIKTQDSSLRDFTWQRGYGAFSVSPSNKGRVGAYIENQVAHHAKFSFQDEFRTLLKKHGMEWDERYIWD